MRSAGPIVGAMCASQLGVPFEESPMQQVRQFGYPAYSRGNNNKGLAKQLRQARKAGRFDEAPKAELEEAQAEAKAEAKAAFEFMFQIVFM